MDYGYIGKSAVPHVTTLGVQFQISYTGYKYSLVIESSFLLLVLPLLAIWVYFSAKYKAPKKKKEQVDDNDAQHNIESQHHSEMEGHNDGLDEQSNKHDIQDQFTLETASKSNSEQLKKKLQVIERRICFGVCFFVIHVIGITCLETGLLSIVTFYLTVVLYGIFNVYRPKKLAILLGMYIAPVFASAFTVWMGNHKLGTHIVQTTSTLPP